MACPVVILSCRIVTCHCFCMSCCFNEDIWLFSLKCEKPFLCLSSIAIASFYLCIDFLCIPFCNACFQATREKQGSGWLSESWWPSLYSSFSTTVAENLQLVITNVHFRYEDSILSPEEPFAFGITIGNLAAQSTDDKWVCLCVWLIYL